VYDVEETPVNEDNVPPLTVMSPTTKSVAASDNVKVNVDVCPDLNDVDDAAIDTVGTVVSTLCEVLAATADCVSVETFPAASLMVAPEAESVFAVTETPSVSLSPDTTV
jgi:hypothetical protein